MSEFKKRIIKGQEKSCSLFFEKGELVMLRYGEKLDLDKNLWDAIVTYMNDDIREDVHFDLAPCSEEEFLDEYVKRDPEFEKLLHEEFGIEMEE